LESSGLDQIRSERAGAKLIFCSWKRWQKHFSVSLRLKKRIVIFTKNSAVTNVCGFWWSFLIMGLSKDWREFLELLNSRGVDYVIVGAHSLALHGRPRYTGDLDILVRSMPENAHALVDILNEFGFAESGFKEPDFLQSEQLIQLGRPPTRIDLLTSISGVSSEEAFATKVSAELDGIPVFVLSKASLIRNKRAVGRPQDLADLDVLEG
jgi:hypothetical protein